MINLLWTVIIGFIAGLIARAVHPGDDKMSWLWTIALGIAGSFIGTFIGRLTGMYDGHSSAGLVMSVIGAVILLFVYNRYAKHRLPL